MPTKLPEWYTFSKKYTNTIEERKNRLAQDRKKVMKKIDTHSKYLDKQMSSPEYKEFTDFLKANRGKILRKKATAKAGAGIGWLKKQFIRYGAKQFLKKDL